MTADGDIRGNTPDRRTVISLLRRLRSPAGQADPLPVWAELRALGDVVPAPWGGYFLTGFDVCDQVLRGRQWLVPDFAWQERQPDPSAWSALATQEMTRKLSRLNPPTHTCLRRAMGNPFDRDTVDAMAPQIAAHVSRFLDDLEEELGAQGEADLVATISERLPIHTIGQWLGIPPEHYPHILDFTHRQVFAQELGATQKQLAMSAEATLEMRAFFSSFVRDRRAHPRDDTLTGWIHYWDARYPDDRAAADQVLYDLTMFVTIASLETTATLLTNAVWLLTQDPARADRLRRNPQDVDDAIDEVLRYDPPIHLNSRFPAEDTVLGGVLIPKDTTVHVLYGAANHDPRRNEDPHVFDIGRRGDHLTFGGGIHYCLGAAVARMEARILITELLKRFDTLRPVGAPHYAPRMVFRRATSLKVTR